MFVNTLRKAEHKHQVTYNQGQKHCKCPKIHIV